MNSVEKTKKLCKERNIPISRLEKDLGFANGYIGQLRKGSFPYDRLLKIAKYLNVPVDYLTGQDNTPLPPDIFPLTVKKFPLLGEIACGEPIFANEDRESYIMSGTDIEADFCLKAKGDSMIGARILDGDIVFIKKTDLVNNGEIAAVIIEDEVLLKRFYYYKDENLLTLQSENPRFAPKNYIGEQLDHIRVLGKAVAFQSDIL